MVPPAGSEIKALGVYDEATLIEFAVNDSIVPRSALVPREAISEIYTVSPTEKPAVLEVCIVLLPAEGAKVEVRTADVPSSLSCTVAVVPSAPATIGSSSCPREERADEKDV
jgi:hypothetical protein